MDYGHEQTEQMLVALERRIEKVYREAAKETDKTIKEYFEKFKKRDEEMRALVEAEELSKEEYRKWRITQIARGEHYKAVRDQLAERMTKANEVAIAYVNDTTPQVYTLNRNYCAYTIEQVAGNVGFTVYNESAVRRLAVSDPELMPYYPKERAVKRGIDLAYGKSQISATILSGIIQGSSIGAMASDLRSRIDTMSRTSAIRAARTAVTGAQNGGRQASYEAAEKMGIKVRKRWIATKDGRTRHEHGMADGQTVNIDEPFIVGGEKMMFPADPSASGWNIYNCRCTMATVEKAGIEAEPRKMRVRDPETGRNVVVDEMTYEEWLKWKEGRK